MPQFRYSGRDEKGTQISGDMEAASESELAAVLVARRITPIEIRVQSALPGSLARVSRRGRRVRLQELMRISKRLHYLLHAGMDLNRALRLLEAQQKSRHIADFLSTTREQIQGGKSLSSALMASRQPIPPYLLGIVHAGEISGTLDQSFKSISALLERRLAMQGKLISALIYPAILFVASILTVVMLATTVIPRFQPIFEQAGTSLPPITQAVVAFADLVRIGWLPGMFAVVLAVLLWQQMSRQEQTRTRLHGWLLRLPYAGSLMKKSAYGRLASLWSIQLAGGVPLTQAIRQSLNATGNWQVRDVVTRALDRITAGSSLAKALARSSGVPVMLVEFADLGEQTGRLSETLAELAAIYDSEIEDDLQRGMSLVTPIATLLLGGMVATVLAALLSAVMAVNDLAS